MVLILWFQGCMNEQLTEEIPLWTTVDRPISKHNPAPTLYIVFLAFCALLYVYILLHLGEQFSEHKEHKMHEVHQHPSQIHYSYVGALCSTFSHYVVCLWTERLWLLCRVFFTSGLVHNNRDSGLTPENKLQYNQWYPKSKKWSLKAECFSTVHKRTTLQSGLDFFLVRFEFTTVSKNLTCASLPPISTML